MGELISGTVTFLLTDVEGSTRLWEECPERMTTAIARHNALLTSAIEASDGVIVKERGEGDSFFAVFARPSDAVSAAVTLQKAIASEPWPEGTQIRVRAAIHIGEAEPRDGDYFALTVNRCARLRSVAHGGQTLLSEAMFAIIRDRPTSAVHAEYLGEHRLRDLARPERVYQLVASGLPSDFPALRSVDAVPNNFPTQLTTFIGREQEVTEVRELLACQRLVTILGAGGIGKTRLALHTAADLLDSAADGVYLIDLASNSSDRRVAEAFASDLGLRVEGSRSVHELLRDYLAGKDVLLVVDNCEHIIEGCASTVEGLLAVCPRLRILATSREPLGLAGETHYILPPLALPPMRAPLAAAEVQTVAAVRLFVDRALAVDPHFRLTDANADAIVRICNGLDGVPLAIELAAARVRHLAPEQIAERLQDRLRLLTSESRSLPSRQQTLRATLDWSYRLLNESEQAALRRASVFVGGMLPEAGEAVCVGSDVSSADVLDILSRLLDRSLMITADGPQFKRYRLLETVREYTEERLRAAAESEITQDKHLNWYLEFAARMATLVRDGQVGALAAVAAEHDNLRAALEWARLKSDPPSSLIKMTASLGFFWGATGAEREAEFWFKEAIARSAGARGRDRAALLASAGYEFLETQSQEALRDECLELAREEGDPELTVRALALRGALNYATARRVDVEASMPFISEALQLSESLEDPWYRSTLQVSLGHRYSRLGQLEAARLCYLQALAHSQQAGLRGPLANAYTSLADIARSVGQTGEAIDWDRQGLSVFEELGFTAPAARSRINLGFSLARASHTRDAAGHLRVALAYRLETGIDNQSVSLARIVAATSGVALGLGLFEKAARLLGSQMGPRFMAFPADLGDLQAFRQGVIEAVGAAKFERAYEEGVALAQDDAVYLATDVLQSGCSSG